ncbi:MAG: glucan biosynthesis protein D [Hyphomicrobiales bacterium]|nr:MAG: glucan biosynthesis protein D [Hyphomicrobiales bacterium]
MTFFAFTRFQPARRLSALAVAVLLALPGLSAAGHAAEPKLGPPEDFSFDILSEKARALAAEPFKPHEPAHPELLDRIDYDAHWKIRFNEDATVFAGKTAPLQFFHLGRFFRAPVRMSLVADGKAREILYSADYFSMPDDSPAKAIENEAGFAGFRIMRDDLKTDWISFLGGAYFRTDGAETQYGLSARGVAIDTGLAKPEEFPRFTEFYFSDGEVAGENAVIYALLDGPSVTGAYRIRAANGDGQVLDVTATLFFRNAVERVGIAPLTSMFWYSEMNRASAYDWRPEVHDSDGLAIETGTGERIWRPLNNPDRVVTSSFVDEDVKGFGLIQRDRAFANYQDDGVFYNRRPSVWIEPVGEWGKGAVQLVEIPTNDEIFDNIVAYWNPERAPVVGEPMTFSYKLHWNRDEPYPGALARTVASRTGRGGVPGQPRPDDQVRIVIDFEGSPLAGLTQKDAVKAKVTASGGTVKRAYTLPIVGTKNAWRLTCDLEVPADAGTIDIRAFLSKDGKPLTETWLGQMHASQVAKAARH